MFSDIINMLLESKQVQMQFNEFRICLEFLERKNEKIISIIFKNILILSYIYVQLFDRFLNVHKRVKKFFFEIK